MKRLRPVQCVVVVVLFVIGGCLRHEYSVRKDSKRMDALAAQVQGLVRPGMPAVLARRALDDLGIKHSEVKPSAADDSFLDGEKFGMIAMIRHEAWQVVTRDVLIRVYFDADSLVTRVETRDVFTGP